MRSLLSSVRGRDVGAGPAKNEEEENEGAEARIGSECEHGSRLPYDAGLQEGWRCAAGSPYHDGCGSRACHIVDAHSRNPHGGGPRQPGSRSAGHRHGALGRYGRARACGSARSCGSARAPACCGRCAASAAAFEGAHRAAASPGSAQEGPHGARRHQACGACCRSEACRSCRRWFRVHGQARRPAVRREPSLQRAPCGDCEGESRSQRRPHQDRPEDCDSRRGRRTSAHRSRHDKARAGEARAACGDERRRHSHGRQHHASGEEFPDGARCRQDDSRAWREDRLLLQALHGAHEGVQGPQRRLHRQDRL